jgi:hypothetical protein
MRLIFVNQPLGRLTDKQKIMLMFIFGKCVQRELA